MTHPVTRVLALLELLQSRPGLTGRELARRLDVDERTLRRYAARLTDLGIPVEAARGRYGGYRLLPGYRLPPLMLTDDEAVAVVLGLLAGERLGLATSSPAAATALAKLERMLPAGLRDRVRSVRDTIAFTVPARPAAAAGADVLLTLGAAVRSRTRVVLRYRSWSGAESERDVDPYGIVFHAGRWYLRAHDHHRAERRTFRLDRVLSATAAAESFTPPEGLDPTAEVVEGLATTPYTWEVEVVLRATLAEARREVPAAVATLAETSDGVVLRARAESLAGVARMLAGTGLPFEVRRPDELRTELAALAARLAAAARPGQ
ncbi:helix-turn-helix transcriptional regulator [Marinitenerispora sediminis]|uniref:Transcriptional regulator n=1 Tax=Marinitenerispora sediminis TaxID=1931232 RepID=A0A368T8V1_9ACTN|nr:YafY family protein [Marinitenerispora sediminis]RCV55443.1 transcriptional regulator [Marinitenerispora sediminis]RCV60789.1 transcriptional regulator [Marinitenerispora sediminis]RCV61740.1 transcriptional regulator [Marinitenerispora sediminis]